MIVGVPREIKPGEARVALTPPGARALAEVGHRVVVERGAGGGRGVRDDEYPPAGAALAAAHEGRQRPAPVPKGQEPPPPGAARPRPGHNPFTSPPPAPPPRLGAGL